VGEDTNISPDVEDIILNGQGQLLNQFNNEWESQFHVDDNLNIYVSDINNHRVVKYAYDAYDQDPVLIAGDENGNSGNSLNLLNLPRGMVVASDGTVYVADYNNNRVMKFTEGTAEGEVILNQRVRGALYLDDNDALYMVTWNGGYVYKKEPGKTIEQLTTDYLRKLIRVVGRQFGGYIRI
jgi:sugar lactone lactonase YvrE